MTHMTMTIGDLCISPYNVRINDRSANAVEGMAESLLHGQLQPICVHPMPRKGKEPQIYGCFTGGRRYRAFKLLIERGQLPADHPIQVDFRDITDPGELRELSLAENLQRAELLNYEVYAAVHEASKAGRSLERIAESNGQTLKQIRQWARLGGLAPAVFTALRDGQISDDVARAIGGTADHDLQLWAFDQIMRMGDWQRKPSAVHRLLKIGDDAQRNFLEFVGLEAYRLEGGTFELDLFADQADMRGRVVDEGLLMKMVEARLEDRRKLLRKQAGDRDLRFEAEGPKDGFGYIARDLYIEAAYHPLSAEDEERLEYLQNEMAELGEQAKKIVAECDGPERAERIAALDVDYLPLETEAGEIEGRRRLILPEGDVFGTLTVERGELTVEFWWANRRAKASAERAQRSGADVGGETPASAPLSAGPIGKAAEVVQGGRAIDCMQGYGYRQQADAFLRETQGLPAAGVDALRSIRREVLRMGLIGEAREGGTVGRDYLIFCLLRFELTGGHGHEIGSARAAGSRDNELPTTRAHLKATRAHAQWSELLEWLKDFPFLVEKDLVAAFRSYREEDPLLRDIAAAALAGCLLERSANADGYRIPLHDVLGSLCGLDRDAVVRGLVEPTDDFVELLPKEMRLHHAEPFVDKATFRALGKAKAADIVAPVARALRGAQAWIHPLLQFRAPAPAEQAPASAEAVDLEEEVA